LVLDKSFLNIYDESGPLPAPDCVRQLATGRNAAEQVPESGFAEESSMKTWQKAGGAAE
jgi:hypothetical protein